jgi:uncharacterized protein involved in exopolysaccharide biosynthesis
MASSLTPVGPQTLGTQAPQNLPYLPEVGGGLAAPHHGADSGGLSLGRLFQGLRRYKWLILALTLAGLGAGVLATRYISP